jgi:hypothetical protein
MGNEGRLMNVRIRLQIAAGVLVLGATGCGLTGPSCLDQQKRGDVTSVAGEVGAGAIAMHVVPYGTEGSQNDLRISWPGQSSGSPVLKVYATKIGCASFSPTTPSSGCGTIGSPGGTLSPNARPCVTAHTCQPTDDDIVQNSLTIASGQGNPDIIGSPAQYKLWVVGDPSVAVRYSITITWFRGPDC